MTLGFSKNGAKSAEKKKVLNAIRRDMEDGLLIDRTKMAYLVSLAFTGPSEAKQMKINNTTERIRKEGGNTLIMGASIAIVFLVAGLALNFAREEKCRKTPVN